MRHWGLGLLILGLLTQAACAKRDAPRDCPEQPTDALVVSPGLMAFLSRARAAHHAADGLEEKEPRSALAQLEKLIRGPLPPGNPTEAREVLADTRARMADLRSQLGDFEGALRDIEGGLELAKEITYFRGHLFEVQGLVHDRRAKALKESGKQQEAEEAKEQALSAYERSMGIQAKVIEEALEGKGTP